MFGFRRCYSRRRQLARCLRETKEEIGIVLSISEAILLQTIIREDKDDIRDTFLFRKDISIDALTFHPEEVVAAKWVSKHEYERMCNEEIVAPPVRDFWTLYTSELNPSSQAKPSLRRHK